MNKKNSIIIMVIKMKKIFQILLIFILSISLVGCFKAKTISINTTDAFKRNDFETVNKNGDINIILENMNKALEKIEVFDVSAMYDNHGEKFSYNATIKVILEDSIKNTSLIASANINGKEVVIYMRDQIVNVSYPFKKLKGGIKDSLDNFVKEMPAIAKEMDLGDITVEEINDYLNKSIFENIDLVEILNGFTVTMLEEAGKYIVFAKKDNLSLIMKLDQHFRIVHFESTNKNDIVIMDFSYPVGVVELVFPASLNGLTYFKINKALSLINAND